MDDLNKIKNWFYTNYESLDKWFTRETINMFDKAFSDLETLGSDIIDIKVDEGVN